MKPKEKWSYAKLINLFIGSLGFALILIGIMISSFKDWGGVFLSIGTSVLASSIVVYLSSRYTLKQNMVTEIIEEWGIISITETRALMNSHINENLRINKKNLDIMAFGLKNFRDTQKDLIKEKVKLGMSIRILTINPDSEYLLQRELDEGMAKGEIKHTINSLINWVDELKRIQKINDQIKIKFYNSLPQDFYFKLDKAVYIGPYLHDIGSQQTITYEFKRNSRGYDYYTRYFEQLWDNIYE